MLIGITGGIGMGKTTVLNEFSHLGAPVMDADDIAHALYNPGTPACQAMVQRWGNAILDEHGAIRRPQVGAIVFQNPQELAWLNSLLHPLIRAEMKQRADAVDGPVYCAVPLLYESGWEHDADCVVAVWCPPDVQLKRLQARGWSNEEITRRINSQIPADEKLHRADYAIITDCSWDNLSRQCADVHNRILAR